jgi:hypothetical protein
MNDIYYQKYLKYKSKYIKLKELYGSGGPSVPSVRKPQPNNSVVKMNDYDNDNALKDVINNFVNKLSEVDKTKLNIPTIPENHKDLNYTNEELKDFQLFRYKIFVLLSKKIKVSLDNFKKINELGYYVINRLLILDDTQFIKILNLSLPDLQKFLNLQKQCREGNCDMNRIFSWTENEPPKSLSNLLSHEIDIIIRSLNDATTFNKLISDPKQKSFKMPKKK